MHLGFSGINGEQGTNKSHERGVGAEKGASNARGTHQAQGRRQKLHRRTTPLPARAWIQGLRKFCVTATSGDCIGEL